MPGQTGHSDRALRSVRFFPPIFFPSSFSLSVSLSFSLDSCLDFLQFQGPFCGVESRWKTNRQRQCRRNNQDLGLAVSRLPVDAASTGNPQTASPKSWWCCPSYRWQFAFHRLPVSTPLNGPWNCDKSSHESTEPERKNWKNLRFRVPSHWALANVHFEIFTFISFSSICLSPKSYLLE